MEAPLEIYKLVAPQEFSILNFAPLNKFLNEALTAGVWEQGLKFHS